MSSSVPIQWLCRSQAERFGGRGSCLCSAHHRGGLLRWEVVRLVSSRLAMWDVYGDASQPQWD